ncbi:MAG: DEAD/DEAH box helicase [Candidatus Babeliales bacterium]
MPSLTLYQHQSEAVQAVIDSFSGGIYHQLISLPTASGKTVIIAAIAQHFNKRTLILAHRHELIEQAVKTLKRYWPKVSIGICEGARNDFKKQIVIGSVLSCCRPKRLEQLKSQGFEILIIDEAHHTAANAYKVIIDALGFGAGSKKLLLGGTATPERADGKTLGDIFDKVTYTRSTGDLIAAGILSPVIGRKVLTRETLKGVKIRMGDYETSGLSRAINTPNRNKLVVASYKTYAAERKAICFCADVNHCHDVATEFNQQGVKAAAVWGSMPTEQRKKVLSDFKKDRINVVTSCGVLTEGFDEPSITAVLVARPTKSRTLYIQMVGRGLRKHPGKVDCLVLDFTDMGHVLKNALSLATAIPEAQIVHEEQEDQEKAPQERRPTPNYTLELPRSHQWDILGGDTTRLVWVPINDGQYSLADDNKDEIIVSPINGGFIAEFYQPEGLRTTLIQNAVSFEACIRWCEDFATSYLSVRFATRNLPSGVQDQLPTDKQIQLLELNNIPLDGLNRAQASTVIRRIIALQNQTRRCHDSQELADPLSPITPQQRLFLTQQGVAASGWTQEQAHAIISRLKNDGQQLEGCRH